VEQHYVVEVGKSITFDSFVLHIISIYCMPNIVEMVNMGCRHYSKMNRELLFDSCCISLHF